MPINASRTVRYYWEAVGKVTWYGECCLWTMDPVVSLHDHSNARKGTDGYAIRSRDVLILTYRNK
jgi:hypothetical protein